MSFANLKRQSGNLEKLSKALDEINKPTDTFKEDENFWRPEVDKAGNGLATIRFLPTAPLEIESLPWVKSFSHGFQGVGGKWFIDKCPTTKGKPCPVCEHNSVLWNSGIEANKEVVRKQKRKLNYVSSVYIVSDPKHPENDGKVKLFRYGKKIFDKINEKMNPPVNADGTLVDKDDVPINPFDLWKGANFKLKIRKVEGYANYDKSEFVTSAPLADSDTALEKIWNSQPSLLPLVDDSLFKSYDELKKTLDRTLGLNGAAPSKTTVDSVKESYRNSTPPASSGGTELSDDEDLADFRRLAELTE